MSILLMQPMSTGSALAAEEPKRGGTTIIGIGGDPPAVNPVTSTGIPNQLIGCMVYEGLVDATKEGEILPRLAKAWSVSEDGLEYTFDLNEATWHDGQPFTSEDVKYSILEVSAKYGPVFQSAGEKIERIETPNPRTVKIHLKQPFGPFLMSLACAQGGAIMPKHLFEGTDPLNNPASLSKPVGTGAFMLQEWVRGDHLTLVRNPNYWNKGLPYLDSIIAKIIPQPSAFSLALQAGEIDHVLGYYFPPSDLKVVQSNPSLKVVEGNFPPSTNMLFLNVTHKPLDDPKVRQALMIALNRSYLLQNVYYGVGGEGVSPINSRVTWAYNPDADFRKLYPHDPAAANALLDEAGYARDANGTRFKLTFVHRSDAPDRAQAGQAIKSMWRDIGVDLELVSLERAAEVDRVFKDRNFDVAIQGYTTYGDPALGVARIYVTSAIGRPFGNPSGYSNPEVDELFKKGEAATSLDERARYYKEVQTILARDLPVLPMHENVGMDAANANLKGVWGIYQGYGSWDRAWLDQ